MVGIHGDHVSTAVQCVSASGDPLDNPLLVGSGVQPPHVAFDGTNYLVAWVDDGGVRGAVTTVIKAVFVSPNGFVMGSPSPVTASGLNQILQSVVFGAGRFLLVWQETSGVTGQDILGVFIDEGSIRPQLVQQPSSLAHPQGNLGGVGLVPTSFVIAGSALAEAQR